MNWPFRSLRTLPPASPFASPLDCESIEPLLPLYADGMASPSEVRLVESHLPSCKGCRESLFWMQATHRALAARPVAVPPADLHSRIAEAIAASSAPSLRPARSFTLRPAYAAAATLTALGLILASPLLHSPVPSVSTVNVVKPAPPRVASVPTVLPRVKNVLPPTVRVKPHQALVARNVPAATPQHDSAKSVTAEHAFSPKKTVPVNAVASPDRVADNAPAPTHAFVPVHVQVKPSVHPQQVSPEKLMASAKVSPAEKRHPSVSEPPIIKPNAEVPMLARHDKEPLRVPVTVAPSTVTVQPPMIRTASLTTKLGGPLAGVNAYAKTMSTVAYGKTYLMGREISRGEADGIHVLDHEHFAYVDAIHGPSSP